MRYIAIAIIVALLSACGAKGPLFLPKDSDQQKQQKEEKPQ